MFVDDRTLFATVKDLAEKSEILNRDLAKISAWAVKWKVTFNPKTSKDMIFTRKVLNDSPPLIFNGIYVDRVNLHRHLGVYLNCDLDWSYQSCLKGNRKRTVLKSVKYLNRKTFDLLYKVTVRSVIDYSLLIYSNNRKVTELNRLEQLQYKAAKLVRRALEFTSYEKLNVNIIM